MMPAGLHIVRKLRAGKPARWYVYAWRGGPQIAAFEGARPKITAELTDLAAKKRDEKQAAPVETIRTLGAEWKSSPEWARYSPQTKTNWSLWIDRINEEFGNAAMEVFADRRVRRDVIKWRDKWASQPRTADMAIQCFSRMLSFAVDRGMLPSNVLTGVADLYDVNRSEVIWEAHHFDAFNAEASEPLKDAIEFAACTGLRRGDLVQIPWSAVGEHAIVWDTGKSRGKRRVYVPLLPETRALLSRIKARHAAEMAKRPEAKRKPLPPTVLASSRWTPWDKSGLSTGIERVKTEAGLTVRLHDLRGTFATRCMVAGLTNDQIAELLGWSPEEVERIRRRYVDQARVVVAIGKRLAGGV